MLGRVVDHTKTRLFNEHTLGKGKFFDECYVVEVNREEVCLKVVQLARGVIQEDNDLLDIRREQDKQAQRGQEASWSLAQKSADVYEDLLESVLFYYRENVGATEKGSTEDGDLRHS